MFRLHPLQPVVSLTTTPNFLLSPPPRGMSVDRGSVILLCIGLWGSLRILLCACLGYKTNSRVVMLVDAKLGSGSRSFRNATRNTQKAGTRVCMLCSSEVV
jgi:hypothetical protein